MRLTNTRMNDRSFTWYNAFKGICIPDERLDDSTYTKPAEKELWVDEGKKQQEIIPLMKMKRFGCTRNGKNARSMRIRTLCRRGKTIKGKSRQASEDS
jgi:hypothetical protein